MNNHEKNDTLDYYKTKLKEIQKNVSELNTLRKAREESNEETIYLIKRILSAKESYDDENTQILLMMMDDVKKNQLDMDYQIDEYQKDFMKKQMEVEEQIIAIGKDGEKENV